MANETHQQSATMADVIIQNSLFKNGQFPNQLNYLGCDNNFKGEMTYENLEKVTPKIIAYKQYPNKRDAYEIYPFFVYHSPGNKNESIPDMLNMDQLMYLSGIKSLDSGTKFIDLTLTNNYHLGLSNNYYRLGILLFDLIENGSYTNLIYNNTDEHPACWQINIPLTDESTIHKSYSLPEILGYFGYTTPEDKSEIWQKICGIDGTPRCLIIGLYQYVQNEIDTAFLDNYDTILKSCKIKIHYTNYQLTDDNQNNYEKQVNELITVKDVSSLNNTSHSNSSTYISVPENYMSEIYHDIPHIQLEKDPNEIHIYDYYRNYKTHYENLKSTLISKNYKLDDISDSIKCDCLKNSLYFSNVSINKISGGDCKIQLADRYNIKYQEDYKDFQIQKYQFFTNTNFPNINICCNLMIHWYYDDTGGQSHYYHCAINTNAAGTPIKLTYNIKYNNITDNYILLGKTYYAAIGEFVDFVNDIKKNNISAQNYGQYGIYIIPFYIDRYTEGNTTIKLGDSNVYYHKIVYNPDVIK